MKHLQLIICFLLIFFSMPIQLLWPTRPVANPVNHKFNPGNGAYHSHLETEAMLHAIQQSHPDIATLFTIGHSIEGRPLYILKISSQLLDDHQKPAIYIFGCHHAREWISVEIPLFFCHYLTDNYQQSPAVKNLVDQLQIFIMPLLNPDGLEFSIKTYRLWRKNRRYFGDYTWGVDLNRNYDYQWGYDDNGSSPYPQSDTFRGESPFSEPETQAVRDFVLNHPPVAAISYHNYSQVILFPWGYTREHCPDYSEFLSIAHSLSQTMKTANNRQYSYGASAEMLYPTNGDLDDWLYGNFGTLAFTIELPPAYFFLGHFFTTEAEIQNAFSENKPALLYFLNYFADKNNHSH
jgi:murein tripeptide amidase MpaA